MSTRTRVAALALHKGLCFFQSFVLQVLPQYETQ
jgi:hypothetical protein